MKVVPIILIGAGKMGKQHLSVLKTISNFKVTAVASKTGISAKRLAQEFGIERAGDDWVKLVKETGAKACIISVSHLMNEQITREAISLGLHVLAEKPVALNADKVRALIPLARSKGVKVLVGVNRRYYSNILQAITTIKYYGRIQGITILAPDPVNYYRSLASYNTLVYDEWMKMNTIHAIDLFIMICGPIMEIEVMNRLLENHKEQSTVALIRFENGVLGTFISHNSYGGMRDWEVNIAGDGVHAVIHPLEKSKITVDGSSSYSLTPATSQADLKPGLREQALSFWEAIVYNKIFWPACDLEQHAMTIQFMEQLKYCQPRNE